MSLRLDPFRAVDVVDKSLVYFGHSRRFINGYIDFTNKRSYPCFYCCARNRLGIHTISNETTKLQRVCDDDLLTTACINRRYDTSL